MKIETMDRSGSESQDVMAVFAMISCLDNDSGPEEGGGYHDDPTRK